VTARGALSTCSVHAPRWRKLYDASSGPATTAALSRDRRALALACTDSAIRVFATSGEGMTDRLEGHDAPIDALSWRGDSLVSSSRAGRAELFRWNLDIEPWRAPYIFPLSSDATERVAAHGEARGRLVAARPAGQWPIATPALALAPAIGGAFFVNDAGMLAVLDLTRQTVRTRASVSGASDLACATDGSLAFSIGGGAGLVVGESESILGTLRSHHLRNPVITPDGAWLAAVSGYFVWSLRCDPAARASWPRDKELTHETFRLGGPPHALSFARAQSGAPALLVITREGVGSLLDPSSGATLETHSGNIVPACFATDGARRLALGSEGGSVVLLDFDDGSARAFEVGEPITALALAGDVLAMGTKQGALSLWNASTGAIEAHIAFPAEPVAALALSSSCDRLVVQQRKAGMQLYALAWS
jgi:WD40 repeat protein